MLIKQQYGRDSWYAWLVFSLVGLFMLYEMFLEVSPSVMTQEIMRDFNVGAGVLGASVSYYYWSLAGMQLFVGLLYDRFKARHLVLLGVGICALTSLVMTQVQQVWQMDMVRFVMGFGCSFAWVSMLIIAVRWFSKEKYDLLAGIAQLLAAVGAMFGATIVASLVAAYSWRHSFLILGIMGAVLWCVIALLVQESPSDLEVEAKQEEKWSFLKLLGTALENKHTWWIATYTFAAFAPLTAFSELWGPSFLMRYYDIGMTQAAGILYAFWIGLAVAALLIGMIAVRIQRRIILMGGAAFIGMVSFSLMLWGPHVSQGVMWLYLFGVGVAVAGQVLSFPLVREWNDEHVTATAIGFLNFAGMGTGIILSWWIGRGLDAIGAERVVDGVRIYALSSYKSELMIFPALLLAACLICGFVLEEKPKETGTVA